MYIYIYIVSDPRPPRVKKKNVFHTHAAAAPGRTAPPSDLRAPSLRAQALVKLLVAVKSGSFSD